MAKYFLEYTLRGMKKVEFFDKLPKGVYRASGYQNPADKGKPFLTRFTDGGTALLPLQKTKDRMKKKGKRK